MKILLKIILLLFCNFASLEISAQSVEDELVFSFRKYRGTEAQRMIVVGEVVSIEKAELLESKSTSLLGLDTRPDNVVVKILNPKGVRVGQTLYLVEKHPDHRQFRNGNIVGEINVQSIFDTTFFGKQLRGVGFTKLIENRPMTVVRPLITEKTEEALDLKRKADALAYRDSDAEAMKLLKQSIALDPKLPDPHFALGLMYKKEGNRWNVSSLGEFAQAWKYRESFSDNRERYNFYQNYLALIRENVETGLTNPKIKKDILKRGIDIVQDSEAMYGKRFESSVAKAWINYKTYLNTDTKDISKNILWEKSISALQESDSYSKNSLLYHQTAILIYSEYLNGWNPGKPKTTDIIQAMEKIKSHGRSYLTMNPPGNTVPSAVLDVLEIVE
ncbi:MAG: hypothetical protein GW938_05655 [Leptospira sp.]|nr:hypothetical protein [Leptospira sp.]NCS94128.1 hypothetical protein [Leptospira sp.]